MKYVHYSFEIFPPKSEIIIKEREPTWRALARMHPKFISVTFGAGGSTQNETVALIKHIKNKKVKVVPHLSCINLTKKTIHELLTLYLSLNIDSLVVIRGDLPQGQQQINGDFRYASELVAFIREHFNDSFKIYVAAYPEFHPEASSADDDFDRFNHKVLQGADAAITQYFFNADAYCRFMDLCHTRNIQVPVIPGIMPIYNYEKLLRFSKLCQADIPQWLNKRLQTYKDEKSLQQFGLDVVCELCETLVANGAPALHFYTLNQCDLVNNILDTLGLNHSKQRSVAQVR